MSTDVGTCEWLASEIAHSHLLRREEIDGVIAEFQAGNPYADATALAEHLVRRGLLTTFQATRLLESAGRGLVLGPYILVDSIGTGSLGNVYKALGKADRKAYALKVLPARSQWNVRQIRRRVASFPTEPHPAVVSFLDVGTSAGLHYLVWPFAEGETLDALVQREGLLPPARAALIGLQIAQALQYCERHRIYHGLIKPSNVMIAPDGQAKLLDFGVGAMLAESEDNETLIDTLSQSNTAMNMLDCISPEAVTEPSRRSIRGDQYSLGCTLYYGLTGRYPFPDGTAVEKMIAHQSQQPISVVALNPGVPPTLAAAIERLMQKSSEMRYNNIEDLIEGLYPLARQSSVYSAPSLAPPPFVSPRGPTTTPAARSSPSLLSAVTPRSAPPPSSQQLTPMPRPRIPDSTPTPLRTALPSNSNHVSDGESFWQKLLDRVMFWKTKNDPIACTLLAPNGALPGEMVPLQLVVHHAERTDQAKSLPEWRGTQVVPEPVRRGSSVGVHVELLELIVEKALHHVLWNGGSTATLFNVRIPDSWPFGKQIQGLITIGIENQPVARLDFSLPIGAPQPA